MMTLTFQEAKSLFFEKLGNYKIMAIASCVDNYPMIRNVSCIFYNEKIYFKTDKNFRKTKQLFQNQQVAMCYHGISFEGTCINKGLVIDEEGRTFEKLYKQYLWGSYNAYSHIDSEILIEVTPKFVELWDDDKDGNAYQIFIDFDKQEVTYKPYD